MAAFTHGSCTIAGVVLECGLRVKSIGSISLLLTLILYHAAAGQTFRGERSDAQSLDKEIEAQGAQLKGMVPAQKGELAESHIRAHVRLARALADGKQYALGVATLRRAKAAARPSLAKLKQLARSSRPPQSWYDETDHPFNAPRKKK